MIQMTIVLFICNVTLLFFLICALICPTFDCFFSSHNWNTLFVGTSAVADAIAEKYNTTKSQVLDHVSRTALTDTPFKVFDLTKSVNDFVSCISLHMIFFFHRPLQESKGSVAVRMALGETQIVQETRQFLLDNQVSLDSFSQVRQCDLATTIVAVRVCCALNWALLPPHTLSNRPPI